MKVSALRAVVLGAVIALTLPVLPWTVAGGASSAPPTLRQLEAEIAAAVRATRGPDPSKTIPPLSSLNESDISVSPIRRACYSSGSGTAVPSDAAVRCAYGATRATRTILLAGDSQAGMWLPALDVVGRSLGWRIVFLAKEGCSPWASPSPPNQMIAPGLTAGECASFNLNVADWARSVRPAVVVLDGMGFLRLHPLEQQMSYETGLLAPSDARLLVLSPAPEYALPATQDTPADCLDGAARYTSCELSPKRLVPSTEAAAEASESRAGRFGVVHVTPLFCTPTRCAIVVRDAAGQHLVYYDQTHINRFFSRWVSRALSTLLAPLLPKV